nr:hypothetical protein Iba_chr03aCG20630 [Ipomoea batatas]GMC73221.1 hypothetical protein Iba_chr03bCG18990 [Ipomoea batatas]GMC76091.1 hypothetical protein Iba_chr03dCG11000 [Ipomoea batatas]GMC77529.1 hypothetical protein Iba_chr03eCG11580 [Ipomoea batatas]GMC78200.1 hypothetical protein Iba_chr03fCG5710 [Ipomoea batatas]
MCSTKITIQTAMSTPKSFRCIFSTRDTSGAFCPSCFIPEALFAPPGRRLYPPSLLNLPRDAKRLAASYISIVSFFHVSTPLKNALVDLPKKRMMSNTVTIHSEKRTLRITPILIPSNSIGCRRRARS